MEAYTKAMAGEYKLLSLKNRAASGSALSSVDVVDLRKEMQEGNKSMFSRRLKAVSYTHLDVYKRQEKESREEISAGG